MQHQLSKSSIYLFTVYAPGTTGIMSNSKDEKKEHPQINQTDKKSSSGVSLGENTRMPDLLEGVDRNRALMDVLHKESLKDKPL